MSNPGFPDVFCHCFRIGLSFSCHQGKIWSVLITIQSGSLLAARIHLHFQGLPSVTDTQRTRRPSRPMLLCALRCYVPVVAGVACLWGRQALRYEISQRRSWDRNVLWPLRPQSRGSTNLSLHQQELCCQDSTTQCLPCPKLPISCGHSKWLQTSQGVSEFLWKGAGDQCCILVLHSLVLFVPYINF